MPLFESILHALGTAGTGGFGIKNDSIAGYSPYIQWVIAVFMLIFGVNFNLYYMILIKQGKQAIKSEELRYYIGIVAASVIFGKINKKAQMEDIVEVVNERTTITDNGIYLVVPQPTSQYIEVGEE